MESILADLPECARWLFHVVVVVGGAVLFLIGKYQPPTRSADSGDAFEIKAAMVDNRGVQALAGEVAGHSPAITAQTAALKAQTDALIEQCRSEDRLREAIDRLSVEMARRN